MHTLNNKTSSLSISYSHCKHYGDMRAWLRQCTVPPQLPVSSYIAYFYCIAYFYWNLSLIFQRVSGVAVYPVCCDYLLSIITQFWTQSSHRKVTSCCFCPQTIHNVMVDKYPHYTDRYIYLKAEMQYYKVCTLIFLSLNDFYEHILLFNTGMTGDRTMLDSRNGSDNPLLVH